MNAWHGHDVMRRAMADLARAAAAIGRSSGGCLVCRGLTSGCVACGGAAHDRLAGAPASAEVLTRPVFDQLVEEQIGDRDDDVTGWFCVATDPFPCPADGCDFVARYMTAAHRIVVWPDRDDRDLLSQANAAKEMGRNPRIVPYERSMGRCVPFDVWGEIGRPTHAFHPKPDGWSYRRL